MIPLYKIIHDLLKTIKSKNVDWKSSSFTVYFDQKSTLVYKTTQRIKRSAEGSIFYVYSTYA